MKNFIFAISIAVLMVPVTSYAKKQSCVETYRTQPAVLDFGDRFEVQAYEEKYDLDKSETTGIHSKNAITNCSTDRKYSCWTDQATTISIPKKWRGDQITWTQNGQTFMALPFGETEILGKKLKVYPVVAYIKADGSAARQLVSIYLYDSAINLVAIGDFNNGDELSWSWSVGKGLSKSCLTK